MRVMCRMSLFCHLRINGLQIFRKIRNRTWGNTHRGFKSHPLRHTALGIAGDSLTAKSLTEIKCGALSVPLSQERAAVPLAAASRSTGSGVGRCGRPVSVTPPGALRLVHGHPGTGKPRSPPPGPPCQLSYLWAGMKGTRPNLLCRERVLHCGEGFRPANANINVAVGDE